MYANNPASYKQDNKECWTSINLSKTCSCKPSKNYEVVALRIYFQLISSPMHSANASNCVCMRNGCCLFSSSWKPSGVLTPQLLILAVILKHLENSKLS